MRLSRPRTTAATVFGLTLVVSALWLGLTTAIAPAAGADPGEGVRGGESSSQSDSDARRDNRTERKLGRSDGERGPVRDGRSRRVLTTTDGAARSEATGDSVRVPAADNNSRRLERTAGFARSDEARRNLDGRGGRFQRSWTVRDDGPRDMGETQMPEGPAADSAAGQPEQDPAPASSDPEIAEGEQISPTEPVGLPPAGPTSGDLQGLLRTAETRARDFATALVTRAPEAERPRAATGDPGPRAAAELGPDAAPRVQEPRDLVRLAADPVSERAANATVGETGSIARSALPDAAGQRGFLANEDQVQIAATGIKATAIGVAGSLRQGLDTLRHPHPVGPVNVIGSVVFSLLGAALQTLSGPPVLPPNSAVTVRTSTLALPESGKTVRADWYFPDEVDDSTRLIYLQHGFMATGPMYSYTAAHLAKATNSIVVAPSLSSNLFAPDAHWIGGDPLQQDVAALFRDDRPELAASAAEAGYLGALPDDYVLVGHSLGGTLVMGAADKMDDATIRNLRGVLLLDAVDMDNAVPEGLARLRGDNFRPVLNISSERYTWNLDGLVTDQLQQARSDSFNGVMLTGGRHIDALQGGNPILQFAEYLIAGFSTPENIDAVKVLAGEWINDMFAGVTPSYDPAGPATAIPLSSASEEIVIAMPWDPIAKVILDVLFQFAVYQPLAADADGRWADPTSTADAGLLTTPVPIMRVLS